MANSIRVSATATVARDVEDVFEYLSEFSTMDEWVVGVSGTRLVSGSGGSAGDVYEYDYTYGGRTVPMQVVVTAVEPPLRLAMAAQEGPFPFRGELTLAGVDGGTRVTNTMETGADGRFTAVTFTLFGALMRRLMARRLRSELDELVKILESPDADPNEVSPATPK